ncbi:MAG: ABC transporter ATP-binding protein [Propionibacteriaceae bacterium]|nr:ABC transporter ATP-binding protein [Propionibacteriaceae bacterium]
MRQVSGLLYKIDRVSKTYRGGRVRAVDDVTLAVHEGDFLGVLGRNGSGKSTLVKIMIGLIQPDAGQVRFRGAPLIRTPAAVGYMPQSGFALNTLTVREALTVVAYLRGMSWKSARSDTSSLMDHLEIGRFAERVANRLSGGERRMLQLAVCMAGAPSVLILDEPTNELDIGRRKLVWDCLREMHEVGRTIVVITHNALEADRYIDSVLFMREGRLAALDTLRVLRRDNAYDLKVRFRSEMAVEFDGRVPMRTQSDEYEVFVRRSEIGGILEHLQSLRVDEFWVTPITLEDLYERLA